MEWRRERRGIGGTCKKMVYIVQIALVVQAMEKLEIVLHGHFVVDEDCKNVETVKLVEIVGEVEVMQTVKKRGRL